MLPNLSFDGKSDYVVIRTQHDHEAMSEGPKKMRCHPERSEATGQTQSKDLLFFLPARLRVPYPPRPPFTRAWALANAIFPGEKIRIGHTPRTGCSCQMPNTSR